MEVERSINKGEFANTFSKWEKELIAKLVAKEIPKLERKIQKIIDNPKNEGQASYSWEVDKYRSRMRTIKEIHEEFK
jgi:hypothetical protein